MSFATLPNELILDIGAHLERASDLSALTQTSQYLHALLTHALYHTNIHRNGSAGLVRAAEIGHAGAMKRFLQLGADIRAEERLQKCHKIDACFRTGTALFLASAFGHTAIVTLLLDAGADPNLGPSDLYSFYYRPLAWAIKKRDVPVARALLAHRARFGQPTDPVTTCRALHNACISGPVQMVQLLLQYRGKADQQDTFREVPLFCAIEATKLGPAEGIKYSEAQMAENMAIMELLLEQDARYSLNDAYWVHRAAHGHWDARVRELFGFRERSMECKCHAS